PRLGLHALECRETPATLTVDQLADTSTGAGSNGTLRWCVDQANALPGPDTIVVSSALSGQTISAKTISDTTVGNSAFLINSDITIDGNVTGITISRDSSVASLRLFRVASGANLTLTGVQLANATALGGQGGQGQSAGGGAAGMGGAIYNQGTL